MSEVKKLSFENPESSKNFKATANWRSEFIEVEGFNLVLRQKTKKGQKLKKKSVLNNLL